MPAQTNQRLNLTHSDYRSPVSIVVMGAPAEKRGKLAAKLLPLGIGLILVATFAIWAMHPSKRPTVPKVIVGTNDEIYYYRSASKADAQALGMALIGTGFLNNRGTTVLLSKGSAGTIVSFVLNNGAWDHPETIYSFEEIGRRIAPAIGGFPIVVRLIDAARNVQKELAIGKVMVGGKDEVYYAGSATAADAAALGNALQAAGFLTGRGASVVLSKMTLPNGAQTAVSLVLEESAWNRPEVVAGLEQLARKVAPSVGGLPISLRLLSPQMEPKKELILK
jgi:hypothetical protein